MNEQARASKAVDHALLVAVKLAANPLAQLCDGTPEDVEYYLRNRLVAIVDDPATWAEPGLPDLPAAT